MFVCEWGASGLQSKGIKQFANWFKTLESSLIDLILASPAPHYPVVSEASKRWHGELNKLAPIQTLRNSLLIISQLIVDTASWISPFLQTHLQTHSSSILPSKFLCLPSSATGLIPPTIFPLLYSFAGCLSLCCLLSLPLTPALLFWLWPTLEC
jgi:hypothetical protein